MRPVTAVSPWRTRMSVVTGGVYGPPGEKRLRLAEWSRGAESGAAGGPPSLGLVRHPTDHPLPVLEDEVHGRVDRLSLLEPG